MRINGVRVDIRGFVRAPHADHVWRDCSKPCRCDDGNHLSVKIRPIRLPVKQEYDVTIFGAFVDVMHAQAVHVDIVGLVWEVGQILELRVRGADKGSAIDGMAYFWAHDRSRQCTGWTMSARGPGL